MLQRFPLSLHIVSLALLSTSTAHAQCQYEVFSWNPWVCQIGTTRTQFPMGMNDLGAWVGYRMTCWPEEGDNSGSIPLYCPPDGMPQALTVPAGASDQGSQASAINNVGVVVGWYRRSPWDLDTACAWLPDGSVIDLFPIPQADRSDANAVNDAGVIVGVHWIDGGNTSKPFIWHDGRVTFLDPAPFRHGKAIAVSDGGIVGGILGSELINARAFRWIDGKFTVLPPLAGYAVSRARGMNELGWIVGDSANYVPGVGIFQVPTLWIDDEPIELPLPPGYTAGGAAGRINSDGIITGSISSSGAGFPVIRVLWVNGQVYPTNDLTVPGSPSVGQAVAINDAGQILTTGGPRLLTPVVSYPTDLNGDCAVDGDDLGVLLSSWGAPDFDPRCDFNGDGAVDGDDLGTLLGEWTAKR